MVIFFFGVVFWVGVGFGWVYEVSYERSNFSVINVIMVISWSRNLLFWWDYL